TQYNPDDDGDTPLDPGIPEVREYVFNVYMDIVRNYDIDGLHFDYIRLIQSNSGYHPIAKQRFQEETGWNFDTENTGNPGTLENAWNLWRRDQLNLLVEEVYDQVMIENPWVNVSAFLVTYTDSLANLGQGYNYWVANGKIDTLHIGAYSPAISTTITRYNSIVNRLAESGDEWTRPVTAATGAYLLEDRDTNDGATRHLHVVRQLEDQTRPPDGINMYAYNAVFLGANTPRDLISRELFTGSGPMVDYLPPPIMEHKNEIGQEFVPPNPAANFSVTISDDGPVVTFDRPEPADDGDLPVNYRLYRSTESNVPLTWANQVMEWWDVDSERASFSFQDAMAPTGNVYYRVAAFDDWNNRALTEISTINNTVGAVYIVETRAGGLNISDYSESGSFQNSSVHSSAEGLTSGIGTRFALPGDANGRNDQVRFTPSGMSSGTYSVFITTPSFASSNALGITARFNGVGGENTTTFNLTQASAGNSWKYIGDINFASGQGHFVEIDNSTQTNVGTSQNSRMNVAALRFERQGATPASPEHKPLPERPASDFPVGGEIIVDSSPRFLNYEDSTVGGTWLTSTLPGYYDGNARYYQPGNFPVRSFATWVIDLPREGRWSISGWVRNNDVFAQGARYRFVDGEGNVINPVTSHRAPPNNQNTGGWFINVDAVSTEEAYHFNEGRLYITLWGNTTGNEFLIADALRFTLVEADDEDEEFTDSWFLH
ncbi:MAG: family 10 glycosylhydrolase, partial [Candidatus Sumerlaeia bacterium]|nr:family 10 glycosylhydrolase [Candidatus Sumerlaeia bacterium]